MKVLVTGSSKGIGREIANKFLSLNHEVIGFDLLDSTISDKNYTHYKLDIYKDELPELNEINIIINNAGVQDGEDVIDTNLKGTIKVTEKYAFNDSIKSVLFIASASAINGSEFPLYVASKGGMVSYMKNVALRLSKYNATANALSPGGVITSLNDHILNDPKLYKAVLDETLLNKWMTVEEVSEFSYFMTVINKSMTGENILVDNGEQLKSNFIW